MTANKYRSYNIKEGGTQPPSKLNKEVIDVWISPRVIIWLILAVLTLLAKPVITISFN